MIRSFTTAILLAALLSASLVSADPPAKAELTPAQQARLGEAKKLRDEGMTFFRQGKTREALPRAEQVSAIVKEVLGEESTDYAASLRAQALYRESMGDYARAELLYNRALAIHKKAVGEEHRDYANGLIGLAGLYISLGDFARAEPLFLQALAIRKKLSGEEDYEYATNLIDLAVLYQLMGTYARAEPLLLQALAINKTVLGEEHPYYATGLNNLGKLYESMGDLARAEPLFQQALAINKKALGQEHPYYANTLSNLARLYQSMGDLARAEPLYQQVLAIRKNALGEQHADYAASLSNLGRLYVAAGDNARAEPLFRQALAIKKNALGEKHPHYASSLNDLARLYQSTKDYAAEPLYQQASGIYARSFGKQHATYAGSLQNLAELYYLMGDFGRVEPLFVEAMTIRKQALGQEHPLYGQSLFYLAAFYLATGDYARAEPLAKSAVTSHLAYLNLTATSQSTRQQLATLAGVRLVLDQYLSIAEQTAADQSAFEEVLIWKGVVAARQRAMHAVAGRPDLKPLWGKLENVTAALSLQARKVPEPAGQQLWRQQLAALSAQKEELEKELGRASLAYRQAEQPVTLDVLRAALPANAALVDYFEYWHTAPRHGDEPEKNRYQRRLVAFVVRREGAVQRFELGPVKPLAAAIDVWRKGYSETADARKAGQTLREKLWAPLEPSLAGADLILVSPDGRLGKFPLAALPGRDPEKYLLEEWTLATVSAPQEIVWLTAEPPARSGKGNLLILGDVDYNSRQAGEQPPAKKDFVSLAHVRASRSDRGGETFLPLSGGAGEIATIQKCYQQNFGAAGLTVLEQAAATTAAVRDQAPRHLYVHLATHGFFAPESVRSALARDLEANGDDDASFASTQSVVGYHPNLLSGIALAGANRPEPDGDDGILTAEDVESMDLSGVRLVVLSACETGLGNAAGGEGLLGLQRAFAAAGARTVVASLWNVPDVATRELMERFYKNLWDRELSKVEALREAQLWMLRERGARGLEPDYEAKGSDRLPPRYWAAFVLSGDWR